MFKWFELGHASGAGSEVVYFIVPVEFDTAKFLRGGYSDKEFGKAHLAICPTEEKAERVVAAMNATITRN